MTRTISDVCRGFRTPTISSLPKPIYTPPTSRKGGIALAVECMKRHMSNEGWEAMLALEAGGYKLYGHGIGESKTRVVEILRESNPATVVLQDKREWDVRPRSFREPLAMFHQVGHLDSEDIFSLTVLRDAHQRPEYHRQSAIEIGANAWITFYHPDIVCALAPYVRRQHIVRTYNSVNPRDVPPYHSENRSGCLLSGAVSRKVYPLRFNLLHCLRLLPDTHTQAHPGYHANGSCTPGFLKKLSRYKVAICTSSIYGYALRKIIEATACGCIVITDLPTDDVLPEIDGNLIRINSLVKPAIVGNLLKEVYASYSPEKQKHYAEKAVSFYSYESLGRRLVQDIEELRCAY